ncbi:hypothetical protein AVEN_113543-1 [Araneus ventricosus]|uniref:Uncharacterized protein n=1 Tax=Araneus ventricosus TaxID=182803 RepID=A0A4Y2VMQ4_ARAVE|nr:hypothetical protein AVEN_113543-1 [Araneus ventricosus]
MAQRIECSKCGLTKKISVYDECKCVFHEICLKDIMKEACPRHHGVPVQAASQPEGTTRLRTVIIELGYRPVHGVPVQAASQPEGTTRFSVWSSVQSHLSLHGIIAWNWVTDRFTEFQSRLPHSQKAPLLCNGEFCSKSPVSLQQL